MPTISVKDATGTDQNVELPNGNGRAAAAASRPIALSTEDLAALNAVTTAIGNLATALETVDLGATTLAALETTELGSTTLAALENITATVTGVATSAKQDEATAAISGLTGSEYERVAASATNQAIGATGATGDLLVGLLVIPATTSPGAVQIKDGAGAAFNVFTGGASSVSTLHPFFVPLGIRSGAGAWQVTTGADVSVLAVGNFT